MTKRRATLLSVLTTAFLTALTYAAFLFAEQQGWWPPQWLQETAKVSVPPGYYIVEESVDGDTFRVTMSGKRETVRLIGLDTPETHRPNTPVQCHGPEAADFARRTLEGKAVRLEADPTNDNRDRYDRLLRYAYMQDGTLYNQLAIEQGFAFAYTSFPFQKKEAFIATQTTAQSAKRGLWAACQPYQESSGRWQTNPY